jgi:hypothetical protein
MSGPTTAVSRCIVHLVDYRPKKIKVPEHRLGYCELRVENPKTKLDVRIRADSADYRPGQAATVVAEVKDSAGQSVSDAEVTLYAVDEGILSLTGEATPDPRGFFFRPRPLSVQCGLTLPSLLPEDPERLVFANKGYLVGGGGRERLRKDFLPCAFWQAALVTDAGGQVTARFTAPDSLTRYRVIAVAHTRQSQFGSSQAHFEVNKPLMLEPALPRFANITNRILARAVVHNRTDESGQVEATLQLDDKASADVPAVGSAPFPLTPALSPRERENVAQRAQHAGAPSSNPTPQSAFPLPKGEGLGGGEAHQPARPPSVILTRKITVRARSSAPVEFPLVLVEPGTAQWIWTARFADAAKNSEPGTRNLCRSAIPFNPPFPSATSLRCCVRSTWPAPSPGRPTCWPVPTLNCSKAQAP